jgi:antitoxin PrlF
LARQFERVLRLKTRHYKHAYRHCKEQVTLRADLGDHLGVQPDDKIAVEKLLGGRIEIRAVRARISDVFGFLKHENGTFLSIAEISEAARRGWAGGYRPAAILLGLRALKR